jgi:uncharacterized SAM-binding protein YcdF (DUF218 family)
VILGPIRFAIRIVSALLSLALLYFLFTFVQVWMTGHHHSSANAQGILVFGTTEDNGTPSPELKARLDDALHLYRDHRAPWIIVTGGKKRGDTHTEAGVSAVYLESHGVASTHILIGAGNDTWQNVSSVTDLLKAHRIVSVLTVTDPFHEYRAMAISSSQGLAPQPSPVSNSPTVNHSLWRFYLKETLEVGVGRVVGFRTLSAWTTSGGQISIPGPSGG